MPFIVGALTTLKMRPLRNIPLSLGVSAKVFGTHKHTQKPHSICFQSTRIATEKALSIYLTFIILLHTQTHMAEIDDEIVADSLQGITQTLTLK